MSNGQETDHWLLKFAVIVSAIFTLNLILISEPAGSVSLGFRTVLVAATKFCLRVADYVQEIGEGTLREWQEDPQHRYPFPAKIPHHVGYALKGSAFAANMLRYIGSFLASGAISYRNYGSGSPLSLWPARILLTARSLFLSEEVLNVSFTPTWGTSLWTFLGI